MGMSNKKTVCLHLSAGFIRDLFALAGIFHYSMARPSFCVDLCLVAGDQ